MKLKMEISQSDALFLNGVATELFAVNGDLKNLERFLANEYDGEARSASELSPSQQLENEKVENEFALIRAKVKNAEIALRGFVYAWRRLRDENIAKGRQSRK